MAHMSHDVVPSLGSLSCKMFSKWISTVPPQNVEKLRSYYQSYPLGIIQDVVREECIVQYNNMCRSGMMHPENNEQNGPDLIPDACTFLDCLLSEDFLELKICILEPSFSAFSRLFSVIAHRAPILKKLEIDFLGSFNFSLSQLTSSSLLPCLEHLSLRNHGTTWDGLTRHRNQFDPASIFYHSVLSVIGKCCLVLTTLEVKGFGTMKEDPLKLILKDFLKILLPIDAILMKNPSLSVNITEAVTYLHEVDFHQPELNSLVCENLDYENLDYENFDEAYDEALEEARNQAENGAFGFFLKIKPCIPVEMYCSASAIQIVGDILEMCPRLKSARFVNDADFSRFTNQQITPLMLESILRQWPSRQLDKLSISFGSSHQLIVNSILNVLGPNLSSLLLELDNEDRQNQFDPSWLGPCTQLKKLRLVSPPWNAGNMVSNEPINWTPETYLPMITEFKTNICLGNWTSLLERKSKLTHLTLYCCHIGTRAHTIPVEWDQIPELWPQLEELYVYQCTGLTTDKLKNLLPRMTSLRSLRLSKEILKTDDQLGQFEGINIAGVNGLPRLYECPFLVA